jgi:hypothetical protein
VILQAIPSDHEDITIGIFQAPSKLEMIESGSSRDDRLGFGESLFELTTLAVPDVEYRELEYHRRNATSPRRQQIPAFE